MERVIPRCHKGDIWFADLDPTRGHEQKGKRPCVVVSVDKFNNSPAGIVWALPVTAKNKRIVYHVAVNPGKETGLHRKSYIMCDQIRCISKERLTKKLGRVPEDVMEQVNYLVSVILGISPELFQKF